MLHLHSWFYLSCLIKCLLSMCRSPQTLFDWHFPHSPVYAVEPVGAGQLTSFTETYQHLWLTKFGRISVQFHKINTIRHFACGRSAVLHLSNLPNFDTHLKTIMAVLRGICENMTVQIEGGDYFVSIVLFVKCQTIVRSAQYN